MATHTLEYKQGTKYSNIYLLRISILIECFKQIKFPNVGSQGNSTNCNMRCSGNQNEICGGNGANSIYSTQYSPMKNHKRVEIISLVSKLMFLKTYYF
jgi:hypothetical protein